MIIEVEAGKFQTSKNLIPILYELCKNNKTRCR